MATRLILVRHGEAKGNIERLYHGITDGYLTENGHRQAKLAAEKLKNQKIDIIYASPLERTKSTGKYTAEFFNLDIIDCPELIEFDGGIWENQPFKKIFNERPDEYHTWMYEPHIHQMPEGENFEQLRDRALKKLKQIVSENTGKCICCFTHGTLIKSIMPHFMKMKFEDLYQIPWYENTSITIIDFPNDDFGNFEIVQANDCSHLEQSEKTMQNQKWYIDLQKYIDERRNN